MKQFFKNVAATIVGLFAFCLILGIFGFISLIGMIASSNNTPTIKDKSVMVLTLQGKSSTEQKTIGWGRLPATSSTRSV